MKSAKDVEGTWRETELRSGLIERCRDVWETPMDRLTDAMLATFLRQNIARSETMQEAERRVRLGEYDGTEMYDGQLEECLLAHRPAKSLTGTAVAGGMWKKKAGSVRDGQIARPNESIEDALLRTTWEGKQPQIVTGLKEQGA